MNLQNALISNYSNHPAFKVDREPLNLDYDKLTKFNALFGSSREPISDLVIPELVELVDDIFRGLLNQQLDTYERAFLVELQEQILKFLKDEFKFRVKLKKQRLKRHESQALQENAFFYSKLSENTRNEILKLAEPQLKIFRERAKQGLLKRSDLSINDGKLVNQIAKLIDNDFKSQAVFDSVSDYVGIKYSFTGLSLELSVAGSTWWKNSIQGVTPPRTMYAHLDESIFAPKAIVYLTDVNEKNGPTSSYPGIYDGLQNNPLQDIIGRIIGRVGNSPDSILFDYYQKSYHQSMGSLNFRKHFMLLPDLLKFNSHFGWDILTGAALEDFIAGSEEVLLGEAGNFVVFDGSRLLHRGGLIEQGERLVLQVIFWPKESVAKRAKQMYQAIAHKLGLVK